MDWASVDNSLNDPTWYTTGEHHGVFATMRRDDPVHWTEDKQYKLNFWAVTRHDDVTEILNDADRFSSRNTSRLLPTSQRLTPEDRYEQLNLVTPTALDNPLHDLYRRPVNKYFSIPAVGRLTEHVDAHVTAVLDAVEARDEIDLVEEVAAQVPLRVMLTFLGVPEEDWPQMRRLVNQYFLPRDPRYATSDDPKESQVDAIKGLDRYARAMMVDRRETPRDDFATVVAQLRIDGDLLSPYEMSTWITTLIRGGLETTANAASVGMWQFLENPDQRAALLADPALIDSAVDEVLRFASPVRHVLRMAREAVEIRGKRINAGDPVVSYLVSANRDDEHFSDPNRFDITRRPNDYVSFGQGVHGCLGRHLARLELTRLIPAFLARSEGLELVHPGRQPDWTLEVSTTGIAHLPVRRTARAVNGTDLAAAPTAV